MTSWIFICFKVPGPSLYNTVGMLLQETLLWLGQWPALPLSNLWLRDQAINYKIVDEYVCQLRVINGNTKQKKQMSWTITKNSFSKKHRTKKWYCYLTLYVHCKYVMHFCSTSLPRAKESCSQLESKMSGNWWPLNHIMTKQRGRKKQVYGW